MRVFALVLVAALTIPVVAEAHAFA